MKKSILAVVMILSFQGVAHASTFVGKIGPFMERESRTESLKLPSCDTTVESLNLHVAKSSQYHIPRIQFDSLTLVYESREVSFSGEEAGIIREFSVPVDPQKGCLKEIILTAKAKGMNPGRPNTPFVEVWKK